MPACLSVSMGLCVSMYFISGIFPVLTPVVCQPSPWLSSTTSLRQTSFVGAAQFYHSWHPSFSQSPTLSLSSSSFFNLLFLLSSISFSLFFHRSPPSPHNIISFSSLSIFYLPGYLRISRNIPLFSVHSLPSWLPSSLFLSISLPS